MIIPLIPTYSNEGKKGMTAITYFQNLMVSNIMWNYYKTNDDETMKQYIDDKDNALKSTVFSCS